MTIPGTSDLELHAAALAITIPLGRVPGISTVNKFGRQADVDTGAGIPCTVWSGAQSAIRGTVLYTYSAAAAAYYVSSSSAGDTQVFEVQGLDANWNLQTINVTLAGQVKTRIGTTETFLRVFRAVNKGAALAGNMYIYEDDTVTAGVPDTDAKVRAAVLTTRDQTEMALYSVPTGKTALITGVWISLDKTGAAATVNLSLRVREFGGSVFLVKGSFSTDTTIGQIFRDYDPYLKISAKSDIEVRVDSTSLDNTIVNAEFDIILVDDGTF